jgi:phage shock protein A
MPYFSRLTDIVTCNLTTLLDQCDDPVAMLTEVTAEMREGLAGAERSTRTAVANVERLQTELREQRGQIDEWVKLARTRLSGGDEEGARQALLRKRELEDLIAALEDQLRAAEATRDHLRKTFHALQARLADAQRRLAALESGEAALATAGESPGTPPDASEGDVMQSIESELEGLRQELGQK